MKSLKWLLKLNFSIIEGKLQAYNNLLGNGTNENITIHREEKRSKTPDQTSTPIILTHKITKMDDKRKLTNILKHLNKDERDTVGKNVMKWNRRKKMLVQYGLKKPKNEKTPGPNNNNLELIK